MARKIEGATNQELASIMQVVSVGKCRHYCKGEQVTIDENTSVIGKKDQEFLKSVLREASKRISQIPDPVAETEVCMDKKSVQDLQSRISQLSTKAIEIDRVVEKLTDTDNRDREIERLEAEYQELFTETVKRYG